jgi:uncharacterized protein with ParB-like and HNH nuclease domain
MSSINIQAKELPLYKVFSNDFVFKIPLYQRPYAWTTEQAEELLEDLVVAVEDTNKDIEDINPYFLGSIVLIKSEHKPDAQVVDGQQRLTTLTILLSVLRELLPTEESNDLVEYIYQKAKKIGISKENQYRLTLRDKDNSFFREYIQDVLGISKLRNVNISNYSDSCKNIKNNAFLFLESLQKYDREQLFRLTQFIVTRCCLVIITTPDLDSAYRIFSVMNNRGLDLSLADILKAEILGKISPKMQDRYGVKWENAEEKLGLYSFKNLFSYIRMIIFKSKPRKSIITELLKESQPTITEFPQEFIDKTLIPLSNALYDIKYKIYDQNNHLGAEINRIFYWLLWIDNSDWIPPAILYLSQNYHRPELLIRFFTDLDRLASGLMIYRANIDRRIERYGKLLNAIENATDLYTSDSPLQLTPEENQAIVNQLNGDIYLVKKIRLYVLIRLNDAISNPKITYSQYPTIEHVLPQNPPQGSEWEQWFPTQEEREKYLHRLGNLVLLSAHKNSEAQNFDFGYKKEKYFTTKSGVSPFALTTQVLTQNEWTPQIIEQRQKDAVDKLKEIWRLQY